MLAVWLLVLVLGTAYLAHRRTAPLPALAIVAAYLLTHGRMITWKQLFMTPALQAQ